jgi:hypothetical protein
VSDDGESETAGAVVGVDAVQPESRAEAEETLSLIVIWQVDDEYGDDWIRNAPLESLVPETEPGETVTAELATAPFPSTRSWPLFSSARLMLIAAPAFAVDTDGEHGHDQNGEPRDPPPSAPLQVTPIHPHCSSPQLGRCVDGRRPRARAQSDFGPTTIRPRRICGAALATNPTRASI